MLNRLDFAGESMISTNQGESIHAVIASPCQKARRSNLF